MCLELWTAGGLTLTCALEKPVNYCSFLQMPSTPVRLPRGVHALGDGGGGDQVAAFFFPPQNLRLWTIRPFKKKRKRKRKTLKITFHSTSVICERYMTVFMKTVFTKLYSWHSTHKQHDVGEGGYWLISPTPYLPLLLFSSCKAP